MSIDDITKPADITQFMEERYISRLMHLIWLSREDLQDVFDLNKPEGQKNFCRWFDVNAPAEYEFHDSLIDNTVGEAGPLGKWLELRTRNSKNRSKILSIYRVCARLGHWFPAGFRKYAKSAWFRLFSFRARTTTASHFQSPTIAIAPTATDSSVINTLPGANIIGYALAELGLGEQVRMCAAAFETTGINYCVVNFNRGLMHRQQASLDHGQLATNNKYRANIFNINPDQMIRAYCHLGRNFFASRYNIGFWVWELAKFPEQWVPMIDMLDEYWVSSHFIKDALMEKTNKPIEYMHQSVVLPDFPKYERKYFGLPESSFIFLFTFDFYSFIHRKNPFASIRAFKNAFPKGSEPVSLVIKAMNGEPNNSDWIKMMELIGDDSRIHIFNQTMTRNEVLGLFDVSDCFVSLHRSEGFGRGPAEAMYLGKPVIVTNYSGNTDFTLADNSCLVDYRLIPVEPGQYLFGEGQVWADADVDHASWYMKKLVNQRMYAQEIGEKAKRFIHANYSTAAVGGMYKKRLEKLGLI